MIELYIAGRVVDVAPDTRVTLKFNSNAFGDISKIVANNTMTISLPRTPNNDEVFGLPSVVGNDSRAPYRKWQAELYVNGVRVVESAYAVLLSVSECYEVSLYWGVVAALESFKGSNKTLRDISEVLKAQYGGMNWWEGWQGQYGQDASGNPSTDIINASYDVAFGSLLNNTTARTKVALLPSVRASWLWDKVCADNGINNELPTAVATSLYNMCVPFVSHTNPDPVTEQYVFTKEYQRENDNGAERTSTFYNLSPNANDTYYEFQQGDRNIKIGGVNRKFYTFVYVALAEHTSRFTIFVEGKSNTGCELHVVRNGKTADKFKLIFGKPITFEYEFGAGDDMYFFATTGASSTNRAVTLDITAAGMQVERYANEGEAPMGSTIRTSDNLPEIKQIDYVKAVCAMHGLWATLVDGEVRYVSYDDYFANGAVTLDWSRKLVGTGDGSAATTTFQLDNFAQRNVLKYKEDESVEVDASGALLVDNVMLDRTKDIVELPFAASDGGTIPSIKWKDDDAATGEIEEVDVEPRIMQLITSPLSSGKVIARLVFGLTMRFDSILTNYYSTWQRVMLNPIVIEEYMRLSEADVKDLDFRKAIYLSKYGARFVISSVEWTCGEAAKVTLIKLPPPIEAALALPYTVTTGVTLGVALGAPEPIPAWAHLVSGGGEYFAQEATLTFDEVGARSLGLAFEAWVDEVGRVVSTANPYSYDGYNGSMTIYAQTSESIIV